MKLLLVFVFLSTVLFYACSASSSSTDMAKDERMFKSRCISCHTKPDPKKFSDEKWIKVIDKHKTRIKWDDNTWQLITQYITRSN